MAAAGTDERANAFLALARGIEAAQRPRPFEPFRADAPQHWTGRHAALTGFPTLIAYLGPVQPLRPWADPAETIGRLPRVTPALLRHWREIATGEHPDARLQAVQQLQAGTPDRLSETGSGGLGGLRVYAEQSDIGTTIFGILSITYALPPQPATPQGPQHITNAGRYNGAIVRVAFLQDRAAFALASYINYPYNSLGQVGDMLALGWLAGADGYATWMRTDLQIAYNALVHLLRPLLPAAQQHTYEVTIGALPLHPHLQLFDPTAPLLENQMEHAALQFDTRGAGGHLLRRVLPGRTELLYKLEGGGAITPGGGGVLRCLMGAGSLGPARAAGGGRMQYAAELSRTALRYGREVWDAPPTLAERAAWAYVLAPRGPRQALPEEVQAQLDAAEARARVTLNAS